MVAVVIAENDIAIKNFVDREVSSGYEFHIAITNIEIAIHRGTVSRLTPGVG